MRRVTVVNGPTSKFVEGEMVEWRLDRFDGFEELPRMREKLKVPLIMKMGKEHLHLLDLKPDYVDIDWNDRELAGCHPRILVSYHNYETFPDLEEQAKKMDWGWGVKIAAKARDSNDALRALLFAKNRNAAGKPTIAIAMGEDGIPSRTLAIHSDCPWTYDLGYPIQDEKRDIYGLIGDPVKHSISDKTHPQVLGCYVKFRVTKEGLPEFMGMARQIGVKGLSVTMPHKEAPIWDSPIPINTVAGDNVYNTDGAGALNAIEKRMTVAGKTIAILGRGGTAKAIKEEGEKRGATVMLYHRETFDQYEGSDILINCTPVTDRLLVPIKSGLVMDVVYAEGETALMKAAKNKIDGIEMFHEQAKLQFQLWRRNL